MKFTKNNMFAIGTAVMMTASLATIASASSIDPPANTFAGTDTGVAWVEAVEVDLSDLDFSQVLEGTPIAVGTIDPKDVPCSLTISPDTNSEETGVAGIAAAEAVDVDLSNMDFSQMLEGTPIADILTTEAGDSAFEIVNAGLSSMDFSQMLEGTPSAASQK